VEFVSQLKQISLSRDLQIPRQGEKQKKDIAMKKIMLSVVLVLVGILMLIGCGGGDDSGGGESADTGGSAQTITVAMHDIYFGDENDNIANPPTWTVDAGGRVRVSAENAGVLEHNWAIVKAGSALPDTVTDANAIKDLLIYDIGEVQGGDSTSGTFTAPEAGTYTVICTIAAHYPSMQGVLQVNG
jgi:uncharacterized cupredoxin-like copper-binding protein